jgi:ribosomal protein L11
MAHATSLSQQAEARAVNPVPPVAPASGEIHVGVVHVLASIALATRERRVA